MKKVIALVALFAAPAFAHLGGTPSLDKADLQQGWNGKAGVQQTATAGIIAHWVADAEGRVNGSGLTACAALQDEAKVNENCVDYRPSQG